MSFDRRQNIEPSPELPATALEARRTPTGPWNDQPNPSPVMSFGQSRARSRPSGTAFPFRLP